MCWSLAAACTRGQVLVGVQRCREGTGTASRSLQELPSPLLGAAPSTSSFLHRLQPPGWAAGPSDSDNDEVWGTVANELPAAFCRGRVPVAAPCPHLSPLRFEDVNTTVQISLVAAAGMERKEGQGPGVIWGSKQV